MATTDQVVCSYGSNHVNKRLEWMRVVQVRPRYRTQGNCFTLVLSSDNSNRRILDKLLRFPIGAISFSSSLNSRKLAAIQFRILEGPWLRQASADRASY